MPHTECPLFSWSVLKTVTQATCITQHVLFDDAGLCTDTRALKSGDFFIPLSGENFDGHQYLGQAFKAGAVGAFVSEAFYEGNTETFKENHQQWPNVLVVQSPLSAYLAMAQYHRSQSSALVIAITGSAGKTTTKEMLFAAFSPLKKTQKTAKNFNNEVGVAQTLLALKSDTEILIVEMGMRGLGEISVLSHAAKPDIAVITNVGTAHIGRLGSRDNIMQAKLEITDGLHPETGLLVMNTDSEGLLDAALQKWTGDILPYSTQGAKPLQASPGLFSYQIPQFKEKPISVKVPGMHILSNTVAVMTIGQSIGLDVDALREGLKNYSQSEAGRWEKIPLPGYPHTTIINDAYNASPESMQAAIEAFLSLETDMLPQAKAEKNPVALKKVLILGGMKELGDFSQEKHAALGHWLAEQPHPFSLLTVGEEAAEIAAGYAIYQAKKQDQAKKQVKKNAGKLPPSNSTLSDSAPSDSGHSYLTCSENKPVNTATALHFNTLDDLAKHCVAERSNQLDHCIILLKGSRANQLDRLPELLSQPVNC